MYVHTLRRSPYGNQEPQGHRGRTLDPDNRLEVSNTHTHRDTFRKTYMGKEKLMTIQV
jgi:hypothetical protein